ncbi:uncharacterized protein LOC133743461 isoform X2 [Rosa rugosa]|uniref:uncharacterized protein LOC133743461 isoform X2 n=1 Tax=Rosa rugosa TaxID=74645 RepID=UPI002B407C9E|nr:uncharacterized protein LOC133743461 isoform X2 [Rosa rugosa]
MSRKRVLIAGGTGYLGQHVLQGFSEIQETTPCDLALTHHSSPPPQALLNAFPSAIPFSVDLKSGNGFEAISHLFGPRDIQVLITTNLGRNLQGILKVGLGVGILKLELSWSIARSLTGITCNGKCECISHLLLTKLSASCAYRQCCQKWLEMLLLI